MQKPEPGSHASLTLAWRPLNMHRTLLRSYLRHRCASVAVPAPSASLSPRTASLDMKVRVRVRETTLEINVGPGNQRLKWLAMISLQRYEEAFSDDAGIALSQKHVASGIMDAAGNLMPPNKSIRVALDDGQEVFVLLQADDDPKGPDAKGARGTSKFLMAQGAAPSKCIIGGPGVTYALVGRQVFFYVTARDTYGNLARNGGEMFDVMINGPEPLGGGTVKISEASAEPVDPESLDRGDGSYVVTHTLAKRGKYEISVNLDGEPIAGSPFQTVAVHTKVPPVIKWLTPRVGGSAPAKFAHATYCTFDQTMLVFGGCDGGMYSNDLRLLNTAKMKFDAPRMAGKPPSPRAGCAAALSGYRLFMYGGESDAGAPPLDELWALDLEASSWQLMQGRGVSPGRLAFAAAASIGNKVYIFGGSNGEACSNVLHALDVVTSMWEPVESLTSQPPSPRMGHSLTASGTQLFVYGGKTKDGKVLATLAVYDTLNDHWATLSCRGDVPRERWGHSAFLWGRQLVLGLGADSEHETNALHMLDLDTLYWDSWDGNLSRVGAAMGLVEGKLFLCGGEESGARSSDVVQFNMGGFVMQFDGVDDEIMVPHLPTIIPTTYTMEAWVKPAKVGPMSIIARSDESYPMAAWSHQLRINAQGCLEHYCEADDKHTVAHTQPVEAGRWYHVAGVATADGDMRLFVDGQEEGTTVDVGTLRPKLDRYFIGSATGDGMGMFEGSIAEVRLWNYAQSEDEIKDGMRKVLLGTERGLVGYWRINEGPGGMVFDHSSYGNLGPIKGDPQWTAANHPIHEG